MSANPLDSVAYREAVGGRVAATLIATGVATTHATINTANLVNHGATSRIGGAVPVANMVLHAFPLAPTVAPLYQGAAPTATQIDVRCGVTAVQYRWFLYAI